MQVAVRRHAPSGLEATGESSSHIWLSQVSFGTDFLSTPQFGAMELTRDEYVLRHQDAIEYAFETAFNLALDSRADDCLQFVTRELAKMAFAPAAAPQLTASERARSMRARCRRHVCPARVPRLFRRRTPTTCH